MRPLIIQHMLDTGMLTEDQVKEAESQVVTQDLAELASLIKTLGKLPEKSDGIGEARALCQLFNVEAINARDTILAANRRIQRITSFEEAMVNLIINGYEMVARSQVDQVDSDSTTSGSIDELQQMLFELDSGAASLEPSDSDVGKQES